ncbi:MAG: PaaI family thioesterase [Prevotella sp.]|jgi:acyl-CoA thioesterase|nr:PaaI family thioesterase [Prevotella sp.]MCI1282825.1 PaaI family thioesterase [Prevotella sp.]
MTLEEYFKGDHFARLIGAELIEIKEGYAKARMLVTYDHLNGGGVCQGGAIFTLADLAFAGAVNSHGTLTLSTNANIVYVHPAQEGYLYAEAHEIVNHHRLPYAEVRITDASGELIAILTSSGYRKKETLPIG